MILSAEKQVQEYTARGWWGERTLIDLFLDTAERSADELAVVDPPNRADLTPGEPLRLTYAGAKTATDRLANALLGAGIGKDDIVMVQLPNIVELVVAFLACARIGAILSPLPVQFRTHELRHVIGLTEPQVFITTRSFGGHDHVEMVRGLQPQLPCVKHIIALGDDLPAGVQSLADILNTAADASRVDTYVAEHPSSANDVFTICWTSGTVAEPKGVPRSHIL
jgi:non-ribosomal peptide synthetase component E (peptide arylation enzyme)